MNGQILRRIDEVATLNFTIGHRTIETTPIEHTDLLLVVYTFLI